MNKLHRGVVALGVSAVVAAALVAPGVQAAPGVGVSSTLSAVYWDDAQQAGGPASNTSIGRFIRAAYYAKFVKKESDPDAALSTLSRIMNNFDRPKGATIDPPASGGEGVTFGGSSAPTGVTTEYTSITFMSDSARRRYFVRSYSSINWSEFQLDGLAELTAPQTIPVESLDPMGGEANDLFLKATP